MALLVHHSGLLSNEGDREQGVRVNVRMEEGSTSESRSQTRGESNWCYVAEHIACDIVPVLS